MPRKKTRVTLKRAVQESFSAYDHEMPPNMAEVRRVLKWHVNFATGDATDVNAGPSYETFHLVTDGRLVLWTNHHTIRLAPSRAIRMRLFRTYTKFATDFTGRLVNASRTGTLCPVCKGDRQPRAWCWLCGFARRVPPAVAVTYQLLKPNVFPAILDTPRLSPEMRARIRAYHEYRRS